ncbi:MAG: PIG-L family deacetylase [Kiritimatiellae bacterium]|nr:PIG-L family deacetylase [Kiritimatiellia bacterium]
MTLYWFRIGMAIVIAGVTGWTGTLAATNAPTHFPVLTLSTNDRLLVMAPHPDDESLACGGIIQTAVERQIPVRVVFFTYGDNNQWSFVLYRKYPVLEPKAVQAMGLMRHDEALQAARLLGLEENQLTFLGYPDFGTLNIWNACWGSHPPYTSMLTKTKVVPYKNAFRPGAEYTGENVMQDLTAILRGFKPTKIFIAHPADHNPDHRALYLFMRVALWNLESEMRPELLPYLTHFQRWPQPQGLHAAQPLEPPDIMRQAAAWTLFPLSSNQISVKLAALKAHGSQFRYSGKYLSSFVRQNELFGDLPVINLQALHDLSQDAVGAVDATPDLPDELTAEESAAYTGVEWKFAQREGDAITLAISVSRPLSKTVEAEVNIFGYRPDHPFHEMPKLRIRLGELPYKVMDGLRRLEDSTVAVTYLKKSISLRVPLAALGKPDRILISARTSRAEVPFDWVAWRILVVSNQVAVHGLKLETGN